MLYKSLHGPSTPYIRPAFLAGNSTRTLANSYRFSENDPFIDCLYRRRAGKHCVGITNRVLDTANDELKNIIWHSVESAPEGLRAEALKHVRVDVETGRVKIDSVFFKRLVTAIDYAFTLAPDVQTYPIENVLSPVDHRYPVGTPVAPGWAWDTVDSAKFAAALFASQLLR